KSGAGQGQRKEEAGESVVDPLPLENGRHREGGGDGEDDHQRGQDPPAAPSMETEQQDLEKPFVIEPGSSAAGEGERIRRRNGLPRKRSPGGGGGASPGRSGPPAASPPPRRPAPGGRGGSPPPPAAHPGSCCDGSSPPPRRAEREEDRDEQEAGRNQAADS